MLGGQPPLASPPDLLSRVPPEPPCTFPSARAAVPPCPRAAVHFPVSPCRRAAVPLCTFPSAAVPLCHRYVGAPLRGLRNRGPLGERALPR